MAGTHTVKTQPPKIPKRKKSWPIKWIVVGLVSVAVVVLSVVLARDEKAEAAKKFGYVRTEHTIEADTISFGECDFARYAEWVRTEGGHVHPSVGVAQQNVQWNRTIVAVGDIKRTETVFNIPAGLLLLPDERPLKHYLNMPPAHIVSIDECSVRLAIHLLEERRKGAASRWAPFLACLPTLDECPVLLCGDEAEWAGLPDTSWSPMLLADQQGLDSIYKTLNSSKDYYGPTSVWVHAGQTPPTLREWRWAFGMVQSRSFQKSKAHRGCQMIPLTDLMNHHPYGQAVNSEFKAERDIAKGTELLFPYINTGDNSDLLTNYGFVSPDQLHRRVLLSREMTLNETILNDLQEVLKKNNIIHVRRQKNEVVVVLPMHAHTVDPSTLAFFRLISTNLPPKSVGSLEEERPQAWECAALGQVLSSVLDVIKTSNYEEPAALKDEEGLPFAAERRAAIADYRHMHRDVMEGSARILRERLAKHGCPDAPSMKATSA